MSLADELHKLGELRTRRVLSVDEFQRAKQRLIVTALALFGGTGVFLYILPWIFVPAE